MDTHSILRQRTWRAVAFWAVAFTAVCAWRGPPLLHALRPQPPALVDFIQEWVSARFYLDGRPVYAPQEEGLEPYLGLRRDQVRPEPGRFLEVNAHPPTSVLLALPFGLLSYPSACLVWNLASLAALALSLFLMVRQLRLPFPPQALLATFLLFLLCEPLLLQLHMGQFNLFLLLLLVGAWAAERSDLPVLAGVLLGTAAVLKLFPAFLVLPFLVRRRWRLVFAAAATAAVWTALTAAVFGADTYAEYALRVMPQLRIYHDDPSNVSLTGSWHRACRVAARCGGGETVWTGPTAHRLLVGVSSLVVTGLVVRASARAATREQFDLAFGLAVTATLLLSPISWPHGYLLLLLPCAVVWRTQPRGVWRAAFLVVVALLSLPTQHLMRSGAALLNLVEMERRVDDKVHTLLAVALLGYFVFLALFVRRALAEPHPVAEPNVLTVLPQPERPRRAPRRVAEAMPTPTVAATMGAE